MDRFLGVDFHHFKAFERYSLSFGRFNILVGQNNAGKSTILMAFRILSAAIRRAESRKADVIEGPQGSVLGYSVDLKSVSVAEENLFFEYDEREPAWVRFRLSSNKSLLLYFPEREVCYLIADAQGKTCSTPATFKTQFRCSVGFVPILGPVDHHEPLFEKEAARLALYNYGAARNFRNIWWHYPQRFDDFRALINETWPGMDVTKPEIDTTHQRALLHMWCPENRKPREIFWSGFGFQVWCQMLTHLIQSSDKSIFLIDEPDIYLHSDLQRRLVGILRSLGPDVLVATHSTEIISEAEIDEIIIVDKGKRKGVKVRDQSQIPAIFEMLGSAINPVLTQLAKTKRVLFVEGYDFHILGRFAHKLGLERLATRADFAVITVGGFNPDRIRSMKIGIEETLGMPIRSAALLDRDFRSDKECHEISNACGIFCDFVAVHKCKEIENFLLVPAAIDRAAERKIEDRIKRGKPQSIKYAATATALLGVFADKNRTYITSQHLAWRRRFERQAGSSLHEEKLNEEVLNNIDSQWESDDSKIALLPGKEALRSINMDLQDRFGINVTPRSIIDAMKTTEIPLEMQNILSKLDEFRRLPAPSGS